MPVLSIFSLHYIHAFIFHLTKLLKNPHLGIWVLDHEFEGSQCKKKMVSRDNLIDCFKRGDRVPSQFTYPWESVTERTCSNVHMVPDFERNSFPCLVKVSMIFLFRFRYMNDSIESELKLNDVFEIIGVLIFDLEITTNKDDSDESLNGFSEDALVHLPRRKVVLLIPWIYRNTIFLCCLDSIKIQNDSP
ncbi:unnamed protein product [Ilex paraguariensis]|uniref:Uncharacterized protein n=1 Tax=Ilex paraguariensis TaxID=185542 RepID=A0ABC8UZ08_9AQUA